MRIEDIKSINGYCLIRLDKEVISDPQSGLEIPRFWADEYHLETAITGTVVSAPDYLPFYAEEIRSGKDHGGFLARTSLEFKVDIEVEPGDHVLIDWVALNNEDFWIDKDHLLVRYDRLILKTNPLYPLNGRILLEMPEQSHSGLLENANLMGVDMTHGRVIAEGINVQQYLHWPGEYDVDMDILGKVVILRKNMAVRAELPELNTLNDGSPTFYCSRRDILGSAS